MILILGASGFIGNYIYNRFRKDGHSVAGTCYSKKSNDLLFFDQDTMSISDLDLGKLSTVVIASSKYSNIDQSYLYFDDAYISNVESVKRVVRYCVDCDINIVYISTDAVFDGGRGNYAEDDLRGPVNKYGIMRLLVEDYIMSTAEKYLILRMGKVCGYDIGDNTFATSLIDDLVNKDIINVAIDQKITPIFVDDLYFYIKWLIFSSVNGVFHLASLQGVTRYELAEYISDCIRGKSAQIVKCEINDLGLPEKRGIDTSLNFSKVQDLTNYKTNCTEFYINKIFNANPVLNAQSIVKL